MNVFHGKHLINALRQRKKQLEWYLEALRNRGLGPEQVFTDIYISGKWGGEKGMFVSGAGSLREHIVAPYVDAISRKAHDEGFAGMKFVDVGCGDFRVGGRLLNLCSAYVGADIVHPLIEFNIERYGRPGVGFVQLDIIDDELPEGDVCFVRQVFQHLSNQQISSVLPKLDRYRWVFITEHYPDGFYSKSPNLDKTHGADIRFYRDSGVYLAEPPFCMPAEKLELVLEVPVLSTGGGGGLLRTYLYKPGFAK